MNNVIDIDVERYNPTNSRKRYIAQGYTGKELEAMCSMAAMIYARPHDEIRETVRRRREEGREIF